MAVPGFLRMRRWFGDLCGLGHVWAELLNFWLRVPSLLVLQSWESQGLILLVAVWVRPVLFSWSCPSAGPFGISDTHKVQMASLGPPWFFVGWLVGWLVGFFSLQHFISIRKLVKFVSNFSLSSPVPFPFVGLVMKPRAMHTLCLCSPTELHT